LRPGGTDCRLAPRKRQHQAEAMTWAQPSADFFVDCLTTSRLPGEILTAIRIPELRPGG
jgi:CO/xanthine dehydrogenase FAD-binding subunit